MRFGLSIPQGWRMDLVGWDGLRGLVYVDAKTGALGNLESG